MKRPARVFLGAGLAGLSILVMVVSIAPAALFSGVFQGAHHVLRWALRWMGWERRE